MIILADNGHSDCTCDGGHFFLIHRDGEVLFFGRQKGQITSGSGVIEYFDNEALATIRVNELGLSIPTEESNP